MKRIFSSLASAIRNTPKVAKPMEVATHLANKHEPFITPTIVPKEPQRVWTNFVKGVKDFISHDTPPEHSVYLHVSMSEPVILKCSKDEANTILAGTSNLQYCAFVAAKLVRNDEVFLGLMHYNGTEASTGQLKNLAGFFAEVAGQSKDQVVVDAMQNIAGLMLTSNMSYLGAKTDSTFNQVNSIFNEHGIEVSRETLGSSSIYSKFNVDAENKKIAAGQKISAQLPHYFTGPSRYEYDEEARLKPEIKESRSKFWEDFMAAENTALKMSAVEKYSPIFLKESVIAEAVGNAQKERSSPSR